MSIVALTPPAASADCAREELASGPQCKIERCHCGVLHLTIGAVTVRTTPDVARAFLLALSHAMVRLELRDACASGRFLSGGGRS